MQVKTASVLLVLEDLQDLQIYGTALSSLGYKVMLCSSYDEGITSLETENIDLLVVSQGTRAFEGRSVLERALQLHPWLPVLVVSRVMDIHCYFEAMDIGAVDYLESPGPRELLWTVATQVRRDTLA
jgi:two-component system response regulator FlrC